MHSSEGKHDKPDVQYITNLQEDDYFFLCTDGILEAITERMLVNILASPIEDSQKLELIRNSCAILSKDNYTAYLVRVGALTL